MWVLSNICIAWDDMDFFSVGAGLKVCNVLVLGISGLKLQFQVEMYRSPGPFEIGREIGVSIDG